MGITITYNKMPPRKNKEIKVGSQMETIMNKLEREKYWFSQIEEFINDVEFGLTDAQITPEEVNTFQTVLEKMYNVQIGLENQLIKLSKLK